MKGVELTAEEIAAVRKPFSQASCLPTRCYTDQDYHELELDRVLRRTWLPVARWDDIENPGDYFTTEIAGEPLILVRTEDGGVRCLSNICQHRRMRVASGCGKAQSFRCPYHRWNYGLDGQLLSGPFLDKDFDRTNVALPSVRTEEWNGFVFVNFDDDAEPLAPQLEDLTTLLEPYELDTWRLVDESHIADATWNWKLTIENASESYHHLGFHSDSVEPESAPTARVVVPEQVGPYSHYQSPGKFDDVRPKSWPGPELGPEHNPTRIITVFPLCNLTLSPDWAIWLRANPEPAVDQHVLRLQYMVPPGAREWDGFEQKFAPLKKFLEGVLAEDKIGLLDLASTHHSKLAERTAGFSPLETPVTHWHRWLVDQMTAS